MGLHAVYRVKNGGTELHVFFSDVRRERSVEHLCILPSQDLRLIREITEQLQELGFALEYDKKLNTLSEFQIFATHTIPDGAGSSADAIRLVCSRHAIEPRIITGEGQGLRGQYN